MSGYDELRLPVVTEVDGIRVLLRAGTVGEAGVVAEVDADLPHRRLVAIAAKAMAKLGADSVSTRYGEEDRQRLRKWRERSR